MDNLQQLYIYFVALFEVFIGVRGIVKICTRKKVAQLGAAERADFYMNQLDKVRNPKKRVEDRLLLNAAKEDIVAGNYERAAASLARVDTSKLKGYYSKLANILTYCVSLRSSDIATADRVLEEYSKKDITADRTFPDPASVWEWRNGISLQQISGVIDNIRSADDTTGIGTTLFNTIVFATWLIGLANEKLSYVPIVTGNTAITYSAVMILLTFLCIIATLLITVRTRSYVEKSVRILLVCITVGFGLITLSWVFKTLGLIGEWLELWM